MKAKFWCSHLDFQNKHNQRLKNVLKVNISAQALEVAAEKQGPHQGEGRLGAFGKVKGHFWLLY